MPRRPSNERQCISLRLFVFVLTASGIAQPILAQTHLQRIEEAVEFHHGSFSSRDARTRSVGFQPDRTGTNPEYAVQASDTLILSVTRSDGSNPDLLIGMGMKVGQGPGKGALKQGTTLIDQAVFLPIPCSLFLEKEAGTLQINVETFADGFLKFFDPHTGKWLADSRTIPWSRLSRQIERELKAPFATKGFRLSYRLITRERAFPLPGDRVVLTRFSRDPQVIGNLDYQENNIDRYELTVAADGTLSIPMVTTVAGWKPVTGGLERKVQGRLDLAAHIVPLCEYARNDGHRWCLSDLEDCLSAAPSPKETLPTSLATKCKSLKVDSLLLPSRVGLAEEVPTLEAIRYRLEPVNRSWTLVLASGKRLSCRFVFGQVLSNAVRVVYRRHHGRSLFESDERIDIRVVAQEGRAPADEPLVFCSSLRSRETTPMDSTLLHPGDIVFLERPDN